MKKFHVYYEDSVRGTRFGEYEVEVNTPEEAAQWIVNNHPRRTGLADTIRVWCVLRANLRATQWKYRNPLLGPTENGGPRNDHNDSAKNKGSTKGRKEKKTTKNIKTDYNDFASDLGLNGNYTVNDIKKAYRLAAGQNHPDKVIGLAPAFNELAENRMKQINRAYEYFRKKHNF